MRKILGFSFNLLCYLLLSSQSQAVKEEDEKLISTGLSLQFSAKNPLAAPRRNAPAYIPLSDLGIKGSANQQTTWSIKIKGQSIPSQLVDTDLDGVNNALLFIHDYQPNETLSIKLVQLKPGLTAPPIKTLTQAEMGIRVGGVQDKDGKYRGGHYQQVESITLPTDHKIGNKLFRYEGFGWESSKVGYRYYFDERATTDIFGKKTQALILHEVGHDGTDYHQLNDWGMDILKVGSSLGIGSLAAWQNKKIVTPKAEQSMSVTLNNGALSSKAIVTHKAWQLGSQQLDLLTSFSIYAESRLTHVKGLSSKPLENWVTGIVKHGVERLDYLSDTSKWNYVASYGHQSLADDDLGMVVFFRHEDMAGLVDDSLNEAVLLRAGQASVEYYFAALWSQEPGGIKTREDFKDYLNRTIQQLNNPISVRPIM